MRPEPSMSDGPDEDAPDPSEQADPRGNGSGGFEGEVIAADGVAVVVIRGELDLATADRFTRLVDEAFDHATTVVLDLSGLEFIDSSGISALVHARERAGTEPAALRLRGTSTATRRVLSISGIDQIMTIEDDPPEAG